MKQNITLRELARRSAHGLEVTLFWNQVSDELLVVCENNDGTSFEGRPDRRDALRAFHHPYTYFAPDSPVSLEFDTTGAEFGRSSGGQLT
jgi:hypothetical protein